MELYAHTHRGTNLYFVEKMGNPAYLYAEADTAHIILVVCCH